MKFAAPLKNMTRTFLATLNIPDGEIEERVEGSRKEELIPGLGITTRKVMETLGTDWGREAVSHSLWVDVAVLQIDAFLKRGLSVVVDDMRFANEYAAMGKLGARLVKVVRLPMSKPGRYEGNLEGFRFDKLIFNEGGLDLLQYRARLLWEALR